MKMKIDMKKEIGIESKDCKRLEKFMSKLFNGKKDMRYKTVKSIEYSKKLNKEESDMLMYMLGRIHGESKNCDTSCPLRKGISKKKISIIPIHSNNPEDTARQIQNFLEKNKTHKEVSYIG